MRIPESVVEAPQVPALLADLAGHGGLGSAARRAEELAEQLALGVGEYAAEMVRSLYVG